MRPTGFALAMLVVTVPGCSSDGPVVDDTAVSTDGGDGEAEPTSLVEGRWVLTAGTYSENGCSSSDKQLVIVEGFDLGPVSEEVLTLTLQPQTEGVPGTLSCARTDPDFACGPTSVTQDLTTSLDVVLLYEWTVGGSFSSFTDGTLNVRWDLSCDGKGCSDLEEQEEMFFPCTAVMDFVATAS